MEDDKTPQTFGNPSKARDLYERMGFVADAVRVINQLRSQRG
jgi:hypothetical protein